MFTPGRVVRDEDLGAQILLRPPLRSVMFGRRADKLASTRYIL